MHAYLATAKVMDFDWSLSATCFVYIKVAFDL